MQVTKDMKISDILMIDQGLIPILLEAGLHCLGCPASQMETLEEAGFVHGIDTDKLINDLNAYLENM
ncbi:DUF1858 domain-containing protein [Anaeropeptidivorans aminofermentans]|jgi:hybrid cluster-associated redox disulfide protein|uniref:DUF1858 domain-containing protein n=1 Tax=Anaeropeptidivorans aminofermentans TaxID=2934315 RepID=UPI002024EB27|nr:DUF1858 domain-containing protein [Anaeropeptidivorans aminofermentans]MBE6012465.1 DUF1858 domain-containing protein [Lachnospiraceae bacterium]